MLSRYKILLLAVAPIVIGCSQSVKDAGPKEIHIDCSQVLEFRLTPDEVSSFRVGFPEVVTQALFFDGRIILCSRNAVTAYDLATGDSLYTCSRRGRRDDEFTTLSDTWLAEGVLELFDFNASKVLRFDALTGRFMETLMANDLESQCKFNFLRWDETNSRFIGERVSGSEAVPDLAVYDVSHRFSGDIESPVKKSGFISSCPISVSETGKVLYHQAFGNAVYSVDGMRLAPEYLIDFGKNELPESGRDENGMKTLLYWQESQDRFAAFMGTFFESVNAFYLQYLFDNQGFLARYDKKSGGISIHHFAPKGGAVAYHDGVVYVVVREDDGSRVYRIPESMFE